MFVKHVILATALTALVAGTALADEAGRTADRFAEAASEMGGMHCGAKHGSRTIVCIVNASNQDTERIASFMIMQARNMDLPLRGWSLTLANPSDYVVSRDF